ncbi:MAG: winged helix-turn-helix transcriptional regulator [Gammaproteobacteria bacterium]|nr:winged helix-turn-helix transcriptional regulator [Gammaproteobacteria bacterium]
MESLQDTPILLSLVSSEKSLTAYGISKHTKISIPQVQYRLSKLEDNGIVTSAIIDNKKVYNVHPALKSRECIDEIAELIKAISDIIDTVEYTTPTAMKYIIAFIIERTVVLEPEAEEAE